MQAYIPYHIEGQNRSGRTVIICDHAANTVPYFVSNGNLGIPQSDMQRHIAYDVGALGLSKRLAEQLKAPLVHSNFSRLVIDPNRGEDDPTLVMQLYDGSIIPANRGLSDVDKEQRLERCYRPYHNALENVLSNRYDPIIISIHTFTKKLNGYSERPWHVGVLYADDNRLANPLLKLLHDQPDICTGDNQPYRGDLKGDTMEVHALRHGRIHVLIEVRNDLIETDINQNKWAGKLTPIITQAIEAAQSKEIKNG